MEKLTWWCLALFLLHFKVIHSSSVASFPASVHLCTNEQSSALLQFKNNFVITRFLGSNTGFLLNPKTDSWNEGTDCCIWEGVECDNVTGQVIGLDLSCNRLQGAIHSNSSLFLLTRLQRLNLAFNDFLCSPIPHEFGLFSSLTYLNLSHARFSGVVPREFSHLSKLVSLDLSFAGLVKFDQHGFQNLAQNLTGFEALTLDRLDMRSIVPSSLSNLSSSLRYLSLSFTGLQGKFPSYVFQFPFLQLLNLAYNQGLTGELPKTNWSTSVRFLDLSHTSFSGELPDSIGDLTFLELLNLHSCHFTGSIPASIGNTKKLTYLDLSFNQCLGRLPTALSKLRQLRHLDLSNNNFAGKIPDSFGNLSRLTRCSLSHNHLNGELPVSLSSLTHLTLLDLSKNNFAGPMPNIFQNLSKLTSSNLSHNLFNGHLPFSAFNLTELHQLDFSFNQLVGPIPCHIFGLSNLVFLDLSYNQLNETIPTWLFASPTLVTLALSHNQFTGQLREFQCKSLEYINLEDNQLQGLIPQSIFELVNLTDFNLSSNNFSGNLQLDLFSQLKHLRSLRLSYNKLSVITNSEVNSTWPRIRTLMLSSCNISEFPKFLRDQENLEELDISVNKIQGDVPNWLSGVGKKSFLSLNLSINYLTSFPGIPWVNLRYIDLCANRFQGPLPVAPPSLQFFTASSNNFTGEIPSSFCNLSSLHVLDLSINNLAGEIPPCLGNISERLTVLVLRKNRFHGSIPGTFSKGNSLRNINLSDNQLEGPLPRALANCKKLEVLDLSNNKINDTFPNWLTTLPQLHVLVLRSNRFHGPITIFRSEFPFRKLRILDLSHNEFTGNLTPKYFRNLKAMMNVDEGKVRLKYLGDEYYTDFVFVTMKGLERELVRILTIFTTIDLSKNQFGGQIPEAVGKLNSLHVLNFSHNSLTGPIPSSFDNLTALESLDLSSNQLYGQIPPQLADLTSLEVFNVCQNQLEGPIPQSNQFLTFTNDSYCDNLGLCGTPLTKKCGENEAAKPQAAKLLPKEEEDSAEGFDWSITLMGYGCGLVSGLSMGYIVFSTGKPLWFVKMIERVEPGKARRPSQRRSRRRYP